MITSENILDCAKKFAAIETAIENRDYTLNHSIDSIGLEGYRFRVYYDFEKPSVERFFYYDCSPLNLKSIMVELAEEIESN